MLGFLLGAVCGAAELFLLNRLIGAVQRGESGKLLLLMLLKLLVLACAFVPVILLRRDELLWCGVGISAALVAGAIAMFCKHTWYGKGDKKS